MGRRGGTVGRLIKSKELKPVGTNIGIPKKLSKMERWFKMREEQIKKKRGW